MVLCMRGKECGVGGQGVVGWLCLPLSALISKFSEWHLALPGFQSEKDPSTATTALSAPPANRAAAATRQARARPPRRRRRGLMDLWPIRGSLCTRSQAQEEDGGASERGLDRVECARWQKRSSQRIEEQPADPGAASGPGSRGKQPFLR